MHVDQRFNTWLRQSMVQRAFTLLLAVTSLGHVGHAAERPATGLETSLWAREPMLRNPVALAFDGQGRLYVAESERRMTVDLDIRSHKPWLLDDLANQTVDDLRRFFRTKMSPEVSEQNRSWLTDRNHDGSHDWRDLMQVSERIRLLEDTDNDEIADRSVVFADGFNEEITGVAAGVMPFAGDVFFTVYPDLWKLRDLNEDGRADGRVSLFRGFGVHAAFDGHDLHGLTIGPEGKIYFSVGDNGFSVRTREGRLLHYPNTGGVLRMNPDGSELEVFAYGLRNVQEFDFDQYGNMFGVDNDGDLGDERERFVYIPEGSDAGWRVNWQFRSPGWSEFNGGMTYNPWVAESMWIPHFEQQPAHITPPLSNYSVGPGGFKFNPGTALNDAYKDFFFLVQFPVKKITAFRVASKGAGFEMVDEHVFHSGLMASAVNFGPDGALYIADWAGSWAPNEKGAIYRVDDPSVRRSETRSEVQQWLSRGVAPLGNAKLVELLGHPDRRIRQASQFELVRRRNLQQFLRVVNNADAAQLARIHALWGLIQLHGGKQERKLAGQLPWRDSDPQIRAQVARTAGDLRLHDAVDSLIDLLKDANDQVRCQAAIALGKTGGPAVGALCKVLETNRGRDAVLRHGAVMGLVGCASSDELAALHRHASPYVRVAAVVALRRQRDPAIAVFLNDPDTRVARDAARAIHDDFSIEAALPALAQRLDDPSCAGDEPIARRAISANLRIGTAAAAERLGRFVIDSRHPPILRSEALESLAVWDRQPLVDRVVGRVRDLSPRDMELGRTVLQQRLSQIFASADAALVEIAARLATQQKLQINEDDLARWVVSETHPAAARSEALRLLESLGARQLQTSIQAALGSSQPQVRITGLEVLARHDPQRAVKHIEASWSDATWIEQQAMLALISKSPSLPAAGFLRARVQELIDDKLNDAVKLDVVLAARASEDSQVHALLEQFERRLSRDPLQIHRLTLHGGRIEQGARIFRSHVSAQCARCHDAGGPGRQAGPVLDGIADRQSREYLLESLVRPSAVIAKGFETTVLELTTGQTISGTIVREDQEAIELATPEGKIERIENDLIEFREPSPVSSMPAIEQTLTLFEIRDLVAYLASLKQTGERR